MKNKLNLISTLTIIFLILTWEVLGRLNVINSTLISIPSKIGKTLIHLFVSGEIYDSIFQSLIRVLVGFFIGSIVAFLLGVFSASNKYVEAVFSPIIEILRPIPPIAFIPIAILIWGLGNKSAFFLVSYGAFFPVFTSTYFGIKNVNPDYINAALTLGSNKFLLFTDVILPASLKSIFIGLKTGLGVAWFCVIIAEMVGAQSGLGYMIQISRLNLNTEYVICGMIIIGLIGFGMNSISKFIEKKVMPWK
jgi:ABC-type nitrate/sulfonate/bicarbonate transport system permease component